MEFLSLSEAMSRFVPDGAQVALEGFTHLIPFAAGHELIRQGRRDLHLMRMTPDLVYDQLIGTGCARRLTFSWGCLLYTSPSPRDRQKSRMPSSA